MSAARSKPAGAAAGGQNRLLARLQRAWGEGPIYQARLNGPAPDRFVFMPVDPRTPNADFAKMIADGRIAIGHDVIDAEGSIGTLWDKALLSTSLHSFMHEFTWLRHAIALGDAGRAPAKDILKGWLDRYEKWSSEAWEPYATAERLTNLCCHAGLALRGSDPLWRSRVLNSMARQTRHLEYNAHSVTNAYERLITIMGQTLAAYCLPGCQSAAERGIESLHRELRLQVRFDGGHVSRNPSRQMAILIRIKMIIKAMEASRALVPGFLKHTEARAAEFLHLFRMGDGGLAVFNGGFEDDGRALTAVLKDVDRASAPMGFARHSGFQRLDAGRLRLVADTGVSMRGTKAGVVPPEDRFAGAASFNLASGRHRIIVNCGAGSHLGPQWNQALRDAAAHSCLSSCVDSEEAKVFSAGVTSHRRNEDTRGQLLEIERRYERNSQQTLYVRRFYLNARGDDLRGEDRLFGVSPAFVQGLTLRFHLHPSVKASLARDGRSVLLAIGSNEGWRFRSNGASVSLEKSTYTGAGGLPVACEQIVIRPRDLEPNQEGAMVLKWAFRRVDGNA